MKHLKKDMSYLKSEFIKSKRFICGYCGESISSNKGFSITSNSKVRADNECNLLLIEKKEAGIYICHSCNAPTFFSPSDGKQYPGAIYGEPIKNLSQELESAYNEARNCFKVSAYTAAALICRKILMYLTCDLEKEEKGGKSFQYYIDLLVDKNHLPPRLKPLAEHIRAEGNSATHSLEPIPKESSERLIKFVEVLLKINYEYLSEI